MGYKYIITDNNIQCNYLRFQLLESVWNFLKGNISFAFNLVTTVLSIVFFSGAYLLNTGLSMVSCMHVIKYQYLIGR